MNTVSSVPEGGYASIVASTITLFLLAGCVEYRTPPTRSSCLGNLKQIGVASHAYHDEYGSFPPVTGPECDGYPRHSWRVAILPFVGRNDLYTRYDFSQPWDSVDNLTLLREMPEIYHCPIAVGSEAGNTPYLAVVGEDMAWSKQGTRRKDDFGDGLGDTVMIVELSERAVPWTKPEDIPFAVLQEARLDNGVGSEGQLANALFANGAIHSNATGTKTQEMVRVALQCAKDCRRLVFRVSGP